MVFVIERCRTNSMTLKLSQIKPILTLKLKAVTSSRSVSRSLPKTRLAFTRADFKQKLNDSLLTGNLRVLLA